MDQIRSIHFDLDGVLIDAREIHIKALNQALSDFKINISNDFQKSLCGLPTLSKLQRISSEVKYIEKNLYLEISEKKQDYTFLFLEEILKISDKFVNLFSKLKSKGYLMAVCSNSRMSTINLVTKKLGIDPFLVHKLSAESVKDPKPSPEIYLKSFEMINYPSSKCMIIEDSEFGIQAAKAANPGRLMIVKSSSDVSIESINQNIYT